MNISFVYFFFNFIVCAPKSRKSTIVLDGARVFAVLRLVHAVMSLYFLGNDEVSGSLDDALSLGSIRDHFLQFLSLLVVLFVFGALDRRLRIMDLLQHHDIVFDLSSLFLLATNKVERIPIIGLIMTNGIVGGGGYYAGHIIDKSAFLLWTVTDQILGVRQGSLAARCAICPPFKHGALNSLIL